MTLNHNYECSNGDGTGIAGNKHSLHKLLSEIRDYLKSELKLTVKENYQIFPVAIRGIDFVGYKSFHTHTLLRKSIKKNFAKMMAKNRNSKSFASYNGWASHCNSKNLMKKLLTKTHNHEKRTSN